VAGKQLHLIVAVVPRAVDHVEGASLGRQPARNAACFHDKPAAAAGVRESPFFLFLLRSFPCSSRLDLRGNEQLPQHLQKFTYNRESTQALLQEIAAVAEERYKKARSAAMTWMLVARRVGMVKDVARMIGEAVWSSREDVAWE